MLNPNLKDEENCKKYIIENRENYSKEQIKSALLPTGINSKNIDYYLSKYYYKEKTENSKTKKIIKYTLLTITIIICGIIFLFTSIIFKILVLMFLNLIIYQMKISIGKSEKIGSNLSSPLANFMTKWGPESGGIIAIFFFGPLLLEIIMIILFFKYTIKIFISQHQIFKKNENNLSFNL